MGYAASYPENSKHLMNRYAPDSRVSGSRIDGMDNHHSSKLRLWEGWNTAVIADLPAGPGRVVQGPHNPAEFADRLYANEALEPDSNCQPADEAAEPYTLQWFLDIESHRHGKEGRWIPRLLEFAKHSGETLLGLGNGLGTDWLQYARERVRT